jgi:MraZ protein
VFKGQFFYSVDAKGRISIPARLRKHVSPDSNETFIMTQGTDKCIDVYPLDQWNLLEAKLLKLNLFDPDHARFTRMFLQNAFDDTLDSQARILIPQNLLIHAGITKEVLILGVTTKIELWNPSVYENYLNKSELTFEQLAAKVITA